jgi:hypothetical protein
VAMVLGIVVCTAVESEADQLIKDSRWPASLWPTRHTHVLGRLAINSLTLVISIHVRCAT